MQALSLYRYHKLMASCCSCYAIPGLHSSFARESFRPAQFCSMDYYSHIHNIIKY